MTPHARTLEAAPTLTTVVDLDEIHANQDGLTITIIGEAVDGSSVDISLFFSEVIGLRYLDETDLLEFWPACSLMNGWLYEIISGGWRFLESTREGFSSRSVPFHREFFVATRNACINVMAKSEPTLTWHSTSLSPVAGRCAIKPRSAG